MKDFILPATSGMASQLTGFGSALSCALPFKIHCSILPVRQPPGLRLARKFSRSSVSMHQRQFRWKDFREIWWGRSVDSDIRSAVAQQIQLVITCPWQCLQYLFHNWQRQSVATVVKRTRNNVTLYSVFIVPTGTFRLPWLRVFCAFSSVVRQMPGYNSDLSGKEGNVITKICTDGSKTENHLGASMVAEKRLQGNIHIRSETDQDMYSIPSRAVRNKHGHPLDPKQRKENLLLPGKCRLQSSTTSHCKQAHNSPPSRCHQGESN